MDNKDYAEMHQKSAEYAVKEVMKGQNLEATKWVDCIGRAMAHSRHDGYDLQTAYEEGWAAAMKYMETKNK